MGVFVHYPVIEFISFTNIHSTLAKTIATREGIYTISSSLESGWIGTLKKIGPVVPCKIGGEISTSRINPFLTFKCFAVGIENYLVFTRNFDSDAIVSETEQLKQITQQTLPSCGMKIEYP